MHRYFYLFHYKEKETDAKSAYLDNFIKYDKVGKYMDNVFMKMK